MKKFLNFMSGKGYYIALILCAFAIGICGYLYYRNADKTPEKGSVAVIQTDGKQDPQDLPAAMTGPKATEGSQAQTRPSQPQSTQPQPSTPVVTQPMQTAFPVEGQTVAAYAVDCLSYNPTTRDWRTHSGIDIAAEAGTPVKAAAAGTVTDVREDDALGTVVTLTHPGGYVTTYGSLSPEVAVQVGQEVTLGQTLGSVGSSALLETALGDHVHFGVTCKGQTVDPAEFLKTAE